ncbi:MAG: hypothetical protein AB1635_03985 [Acidobacteriota bacterium]
MARLRLAAFTVLAVVAGGCINSATLITVKPDGSGTVELSLLMNTQALKAMLAGMGGGAGANSGSFINESEIKRQAERMGGVRFVSSEPVKAPGGFEGIKALFAFDDINKVQVSQDPQMAGPGGGAFGPPPSADDNAVRFTLARSGATSILTIAIDESTGSADAADPADSPEMMMLQDPAAFAMMKTMFQGFKVAVDLEVAGSIVKTNADHVRGSRITLVEIDMNALVADEARFKALAGQMKPGASLGAVRPLLKDVKGVKINGPVVTVEFR